jgi:hypothetical protein
MFRKSLFLVVALMLLIPAAVFGADKLIVQDSTSTNTFVVTDTGNIYPSGVYISGRGATPTPLSGASRFELSTAAFTEFYVTSHSATGNPSLVMYKSRGTIASPAIVAADDFAGSFFARGYDGSIYRNAAGVRFAVDGAPSSGTSVPGRIVFVTTSPGAGSFTEKMRITANGYVGIANTGPTHLLAVGTSGAYTDGGAWIDGSSRDYKDNINTLSSKDAIETVRNLTPVTYVYKEIPDQGQVGFVAEDVPELVATKDRKGLSPMNIVAVLTKVVKEQDKTIETLAAKLDKMEAEINRLKSKDYTAQK